MGLCINDVDLREQTARSTRLIMALVAEWSARYRINGRLQSNSRTESVGAAPDGTKKQKKKKRCRLGRTGRCLDIKHSESVSVHSARAIAREAREDFEVYKGRARLTRTRGAARWLEGSKPVRLVRYLIIQPPRNESTVNWNLCQNLCLSSRLSVFYAPSFLHLLSALSRLFPTKARSSPPVKQTVKRRTKLNKISKSLAIHTCCCSTTSLRATTIKCCFAKFKSLVAPRTAVHFHFVRSFGRQTKWSIYPNNWCTRRRCMNK